MSEPAGKGTGFISTVNAIRELCLPQRFEALLAALPPATAALIKTPPLPSAWVPSEHQIRLLETAVRVVFDGDASRVIEVGRRTLLSDLRGIYKVFVRLASPQYVIERATKIWQTYSRDNGTLTIAASTDRTVDIEYRGVVAATPVLWNFQLGACRGVLEATGVKNVHVELVSGGGSAKDALLRASWDA